MPLHNPDNLSPETIGLGYRLLNEDEICFTGKEYKEIEAWSNRWSPPAYGNCESITYRTKLSPVALRTLRNSTSLPTSPCHPEPKPNLVYLPTWFLYFMTVSSAVSLFFLIYLFLHL